MASVSNAHRFRCSSVTPSSTRLTRPSRSCVRCPSEMSRRALVALVSVECNHSLEGAAAVAFDWRQLAGPHFPAPNTSRHSRAATTTRCFGTRSTHKRRHRLCAQRERRRRAHHLSRSAIQWRQPDFLHATMEPQTCPSISLCREHEVFRHQMLRLASACKSWPADTAHNLNRHKRPVQCARDAHICCALPHIRHCAGSVGHVDRTRELRGKYTVPGHCVTSDAGLTCADSVALYRLSRIG